MRFPLARNADVRFPEEKQHFVGPNPTFRYSPRSAATVVSAHYAPEIAVILVFPAFYVFFTTFPPRGMIFRASKKGPKIDGP